MSDPSEATVWVFNLTDVATKELESLGLVDKTLAVHCYLLGPGESKEVPATDLVLRDARRYAETGALAIGKKPPQYVLAKDKADKPETHKPPEKPEVVPVSDRVEEKAEEPDKFKKRRIR